MRFLRALVWIGALFVIAGPVLLSRAAADDKEDCRKGEGDAIAACTRLIENRGESARTRALAYAYRGSAYSRNGDNDRAAADLSEATRLDPTVAGAFAGSGLTFPGER